MGRSWGSRLNSILAQRAAARAMHVSLERLKFGTGHVSPIRMYADDSGQAREARRGILRIS